VKNVELASAGQEAEKLLREISENTALAEKEKAKVAVIVEQVSKRAAVRSPISRRPFKACASSDTLQTKSSMP
jgi:hypothetical protein